MRRVCLRRFEKRVIACLMAAAVAAPWLAAEETAATRPLPPPQADDGPDAGSLDPGPFTVSSRSDSGIVTELRPLVREICPGDDLLAAVHFTGNRGEFDLVATLGRIVFKLRLPDGSTHDLRATFTDETDAPLRVFHAARHWSTVFLAFHRDGVRANTVWGTLHGAWTNPLPEAFGRPGQYRLSLAGDLGGQETRFSVGDVSFRVAEGPLPVAAARKRARAAITEHLPQATIPKEQRTESGLVPDLVYENAKGERLLHLSVRLTDQKWGYDLVQVRQSRPGELLGIAHQSVATCLAAGTPIATPTGPRPVDVLREGDEISSFDVERGVPVRTRVIGIRTGLAPAVLRFGDLLVTGEHPIYTPAGWVPAASISAETGVLGIDGRMFAIGDGEQIQGETPVWCLSVAQPNTYFAGGILVHNKDRGYKPELDDPWHFYWGPEGVVRKGTWNRVRLKVKEVAGHAPRDRSE